MGDLGCFGGYGFGADGGGGVAACVGVAAGRDEEGEVDESEGRISCVSERKVEGCKA